MAKRPPHPAVLLEAEHPELGDAIAALRAHAGMSRSQLSVAIGQTPSACHAITLYERHIRTPNDRTRLLLARAFGLTEDERRHFLRRCIARNRPRLAKRALGWTNVDLAKAAGVSKTSVRDWMAGGEGVSRAMDERICAAIAEAAGCQPPEEREANEPTASGYGRSPGHGYKLPTTSLPVAFALLALAAAIASVALILK